MHVFWDVTPYLLATASIHESTEHNTTLEKSLCKRLPGRDVGCRRFGWWWAARIWKEIYVGYVELTIKRTKHGSRGQPSAGPGIKPDTSLRWRGRDKWFVKWNRSQQQLWVWNCVAAMGGTRDAIGVCRIVPPRDVLEITTCCCCCCSWLSPECPSAHQLPRVQQRLPTCAAVCASNMPKYKGRRHE
jgi:hypothetical protein